MVCDEDRIDYLVNFYSKVIDFDFDFYCHYDRHSYNALVTIGSDFMRD